MQTISISPKVIAALLTSIVTFAVTKLGLQWDPIFEQAINAIAPIIAAYLAPPGNVVSLPPALDQVDVAAGNPQPPA